MQLPDKGHMLPAPSGEPLQSPVEIDVLAHVPSFVIPAELFECALPAELTGSLRHAADEPENSPQNQVAAQYAAGRSM